MSDLLLITSVLEPSAEVLPALGLLLHPVRVLPADASALVEAPPADAVLMDARRELAHAKSICRLLQTTGLDCPLFAIVTEGGLAAVNAEWGVDDVILHTAGPAEVEARVRLAIGRRAIAAVADAPDEIRSGELAIDEATYAARLRGRVLDLTFKEFELLKFLAQHPGRVFTRAQLLQEVWGYDYFGGTRTVDVHVRRLRAKLGPEHEALIGTVRNVGYRFVPVKGDRSERGQGAERAQRAERAAGDERTRSKQDLGASGPRRDRGPMTGRQITSTVLRTAQVADVLALVRAARLADGVEPLSEHVLLHLRYDSSASPSPDSQPGRDFILTAGDVTRGLRLPGSPAARSGVAHRRIGRERRARDPPRPPAAGARPGPGRRARRGGGRPHAAPVGPRRPARGRRAGPG